MYFESEFIEIWDLADNVFVGVNLPSGINSSWADNGLNLTMVGVHD